MTVKCLDDFQKTAAASAYADRLMDTAELARYYGVSKRTINRVMVELGVAKTPRRFPVLPQATPLYTQQTTIFEQPKPTWLQKLREFFRFHRHA